MNWEVVKKGEDKDQVVEEVRQVVSEIDRNKEAEKKKEIKKDVVDELLALGDKKAHENTDEVDSESAFFL